MILGFQQYGRLQRRYIRSARSTRILTAHAVSAKDIHVQSGLRFPTVGIPLGIFVLAQRQTYKREVLIEKRQFSTSFELSPWHFA
jgi:hypothetical protein